MVRPATPEDARGIAEVHVRSWRAAYRGLVPAEVLDRLSVDDREGTWAEMLRNGSRVLVAEEPDGTLAGFCGFARPARDDDAVPGSGEILALYVDPERWRAGTGGALLDAAVEELAAEGCDEATLWVLRGNDRAIGFYARHGFVADGRVSTHPPTGSAEVRMRRALSGRRSGSAAGRRPRAARPAT